MSSANCKFRVTNCQDASCLTDGVLLDLPVDKKYQHKLEGNSNRCDSDNYVEKASSSSFSLNLEKDVNYDVAHNSKSPPCTEIKTTIQSDIVVLPWMGFGTYRIGRSQTKKAVLQAIQYGYRSIDTAFIYGGETSEQLIGEAIEESIRHGTIRSRSELFITTKHWRNYHGYEPTIVCLKLSLERLKLDYVDLYLMHWPGLGSTKNKKSQNDGDMNDEYGPLQLESTGLLPNRENETKTLRAETWRAMEDSYRSGLVRRIGVSNMTVQHLESLKVTASIWPPAVNQVELHPLHPQTDLLEYCRREGIVVVAYASLGGQDMGKSSWQQLLGKNHFFKNDDKNNCSRNKPSKIRKTDHYNERSNKTGTTSMYNLLNALPVVDMAKSMGMTPAQLLLRWAIDQGIVVIPKTLSSLRLQENSSVFSLKNCNLSITLIKKLQEDLRNIVMEQHLIKTQLETDDKTEKKGDDKILHELTRLCWRNDPMRHLTFQ